jgi:TonB family protein
VFRFTIPDFRFPVLLVASVLLATSPAAGQNTGAQLVKQPKPVYPEVPARGLKQGNVNLIGRIDTKGKVQDLRYVGSTLEAFLEPAVAAAQAWEFKPATRGGKPVEIAANIALRFRLEGDKRGDLSSPIIGDLSVYPADASGRAIAPEDSRSGAGPTEDPRGGGPRRLARTEPRTLPVGSRRSLIRKKIVVFDQSVSVKAKASDAKISFTATADPDWEDGVWLLRFVVENTEAGGGQFWAAVDPEHYQFVLPGQAIKSDRPPPGAQGKAPAPGQPKPTAAPAKKKKA